MSGVWSTTTAHGKSSRLAQYERQVYRGCIEFFRGPRATKFFMRVFSQPLKFAKRFSLPYVIFHIDKKWWSKNSYIVCMYILMLYKSNRYADNWQLIPFSKLHAPNFALFLSLLRHFLSFSLSVFIIIELYVLLEVCCCYSHCAA